MPARFCPLCAESTTEDELCAEHGVPTVEAAILEAQPLPIEPGRIITGRYRVERALGTGGMGSLFCARQLGTSRAVAVKVLRADRRIDRPLLFRFYREAQAVSALSHPNIVQVFDFGVDPATRAPFLAMELLDGQPLSALLERGALAERRSAHLLAQVARGLVEAHAAGLVHRDLKPANIMVQRLRDGEEHVKVLDFGVVKLARAQGGVTAPGRTIGSPAYMSPEQALAKRVDARSDLYSLGCVLFECLTGRVPFDGPDDLAIMRAHLEAPRPRLPVALADGRAPSPPLLDLVAVLLEREPGRRPISAKVVARALAAVARGEALDVRGEVEDERTLSERLAPALIEELAPEPDLLPAPDRSPLARRRIADAATLGAPPAEPEEPPTAATQPALGAPEHEPRTLVQPARLDASDDPAELSQPTRDALPPATARRPAQGGKRWPAPAALGGALALAGLLIWGSGAFRTGSTGQGGEAEPRAAPAPGPRPARTDPAAPAPLLRAPPTPTVTAQGRTSTSAPSPTERARPAGDSGRAARSPDRRVELRSQPAGAEVRAGGKLLGQTPLSVRLPAGQTLEVLLRKEGFEDRRLSLGPTSAAEQRVVLLPVF